MRIALKKFGTTLTSRELGREAFLAFQPTLESVSADEIIEVDFTGVQVFSPSWGDEMLEGLEEKFPGRVVLYNTDNLSVKESLELLEKEHGRKFRLA